MNCLGGSSAGAVSGSASGSRSRNAASAYIAAPDSQTRRFFRDVQRLLAEVEPPLRRIKRAFDLSHKELGALLTVSVWLP